LQPDFERFWDDLATRYELDPGAPIRSNTTEPETSVPSSLIARIRADNALDLDLYDFAEQLHSQRRAA